MHSDKNNIIRRSNVAAGDDAPLGYTRIIYISPHFSADKIIRIFDLTSQVQAAYASAAFDEETERLGQAKLSAAADDDSAPSPTWIIHDPRFWKTATLHAGHVSDPADVEAVATWTPSRWSQGRNHIGFPAASPHSAHDIVMERRQVLASRAEGFVQDSVPFTWRHDGYSRRQLTLWKTVAGVERAVARYKAPYRFPRTGGTLVVDEAAVDVVVAFMTCVAMLRKVRQNDS